MPKGKKGKRNRGFKDFLKHRESKAGGIRFEQIVQAIRKTLRGEWQR